MGKLEKLEEELYTAEGDKDLRRRMREKPLPSPTSGKTPLKWAEEMPSPQTPQSKYTPIILRIGLGILVAVAIIGAAVFIFLYLGTRGAEVALLIGGRKSIEAGELVILPISIRNVSGSALEEVELTVFLPGGSMLNENGIDKPAPTRLSRKLDNLEPGEETLVEINVRMFGKEREEKEIKTSLLYRPTNLRAKFSSDTYKNFIIASVPLALSWEMPDGFSRGQDAEIKVRFTSDAKISFENLFFRLEYPPGFILKSADPEPAQDNNLWEIGTLDPGEEVEINIFGSVEGEEGEVKAFRGGLGIIDPLTSEWRPYTESNRVVNIQTSPLSIEGFFGGSRSGTILPGDRLTFTVRYKNNTEFILKNITLRVFLEGEIIDPQSIFISHGGVLDALSRAIIWSPASTNGLRELLPGESGEFTFGAQTKPRPVMRNPGDTNLNVRLRSFIEVANVPLELRGIQLAREDLLEFKVASLVLFSAKSLHRSSPIPNTGPIPPKVGEKTTYTIQWEIRNFTNNLTEVEIRTSLPPNIKWEGVTYPNEARVSYDPASGEVRWKTGNVPAGTGVLTPALLSVFQVSLVPAETDVGRRVPLTNESIFNGIDDFTGEEISVKLESVTTETKGDPAVKFDEAEVVR